MMENRDFFVTLLIVTFIGIYLLMPVPNCHEIKIVKDNIPNNITIKQENVNRLYYEVKDYNIVNVITSGNSMLPTIRNNSVCLCEKKSTYKVGDIVLYFVKDNEEYTGILHRIINDNNGQFQTKGDNNNFIDGNNLTTKNILCSVEAMPRNKL